MSFSGMCIGGSLDGQFVESNVSVYHVAYMHNPSFSCIDPEMPVDVAHESYFFNLTMLENNRSFGVWIYQDYYLKYRTRFTNRDLLDLLIERYSEHCKALREITDDKDNTGHGIFKCRKCFKIVKRCKCMNATIRYTTCQKCMTIPR